MRRILGLDYGAKTVGVAVSDPLFLTAQGVETVVRERETKLRRTLARIAEICAQYDVCRVVVGLPLLLSGEEGERAEKCRAFGAMVADRTGLPVVFADERLTTEEALLAMREAGITDRREQKKSVDRLAAQLILQDYMNSLTEAEKHDIIGE
ncbi:MAG: Holliday junction resolvase RuvX [Lachnospiraceae bacterium]|nr:Holliday junction resolvase RuvX [Lachnospiraceae bacterium]